MARGRPPARLSSPLGLRDYAPGCPDVLLTFLVGVFRPAPLRPPFLRTDLFAGFGSVGPVVFAALTAAHRRRAASPIAFLPAALHPALPFGRYRRRDAFAPAPFQHLPKLCNLCINSCLLRLEAGDRGNDDFVREGVCHLCW